MTDKTEGGNTMTDSLKPILEMTGISKTFPGVRALSDVRLTAYAGEIHSLMGENGAGKSTLMKILSGAYTPDAGGEIRIDGKPATIDGPLSAKAIGIAVIYQELSLSPNLSVAENIYLGRELKRGMTIDRAAMEAGCADVLGRLNARFEPSTIVSNLSIAEQQLVEIARAIHAHARILIMDEPTTALSSRETDGLFNLIRQLRAEGLAIIYISHRMAEIYDLSDRVSVLRDGTYVGTILRAELSAERLVKMMVGRDLSGFYRKSDASKAVPGRQLLDVRNMSDGRRVHNASFTAFAGEVLGIAGLVGSGRTELARLIFGANPKTSGEVYIEGRRVDINEPNDAIQAGLVYLTEDRKAHGLFLDMSVHDNVNLVVFEREAGKGGILDRRRAMNRALEAIKTLAIRVAHHNVAVGALSGGNQQKVLLSRLLEIKPRVLILDEPTRGVDIGAKSEIYRIIGALAASGVGVIVISSELPEVIGLADRIIVMREGVIEGEVGGDSGREMTQENIMQFATGIHDNRLAS
jgi:ribose transport system ATP-binding protein